MTKAPFLDIKLGRVDVEREVRPDGSTIMRSRLPLESYPRRMTEAVIRWAQEAPQRVFLARRGADGRWVELTYARAHQRMLAVAQGLVDRGLGPDRTVCILSENSIEHGLLALGCMHAGVPYAPISPAYSLLSTDFGKLRHCLAMMSPGLVFAAGAQYEKALKHVPPGIEVATRLEDLESNPGGSAGKAFNAVTPDTIAKVLFTSGSTGMPKGVITTHQMLCSNLQQINQCFPCIGEQPPVFVDWLPWNHVFGGNHNFGLVLYNGGTLHIDDGKPTPALIGQTVQNLREIGPTVYLNVPRGFADLIPYFRREPALRERFYSRLRLMFYGGAGLPQPVWDGMDDLSVESTGKRIVITSGLGMTESSPSACFAHWSDVKSGHLGVPVSGLVLKLVSVGDKIEARYKGPNVTPGYWKQPELTGRYFDEEGFFRTGDAVRFLDEGDHQKGLVFDGRISEDFKLSSATWVSVGVLRAGLLDAFEGLLQDAVITAPERDYVGAILFPAWPSCRAAAGLPENTPPGEVAAHPKVRALVQQALDRLAASATGSSNRVARALITDRPPSIDVGEITDKGSFNQGAVLRNRTALVDQLYAEPPNAQVIVAREKVAS